MNVSKSVKDNEVCYTWHDVKYGDSLCTVKVYVALKNNDKNLPYFSAYAEMRYRDYLFMGGQCLTDIYDSTNLKRDAVFKEIYTLWKKYHLKIVNNLNGDLEKIKSLF